MNRQYHQLISLLALLLCTVLPSCSIIHNAPSQPSSTTKNVAKNQINLANTSQVKQILYQQHNHWKGTRYQLGGLSKKGIDCSGFTHLTYKSKLGIDIPRSTTSLSKVGFKIAKRNLRPGDLVLFKTGIHVRHVGMYLENGKFLHASKSKGVMISSLDNVYWKKKFWHARRI